MTTKARIFVVVFFGAAICGLGFFLSQFWAWPLGAGAVLLAWSFIAPQKTGLMLTDGEDNGGSGMILPAIWNEKEVGLGFTRYQNNPDAILLGNSFATHQLALSDIYIEAMGGRDIRWRTFSVPPVPSIPIIPDAAIESPAQSFFLEMDLGTEPLPVWSRKVAQYLKLAASGTFREIVAQSQFAVLVVAVTDERMHLLRRHIAKQTPKLFWFQTLSTIQRQGFWSAFWLRSEGSALSRPGA
jgi:hypothetical protein